MTVYSEKSFRGKTVWKVEVHLGDGRRKYNRFATKTEAKNYEASILARHIEKRKIVGKLPKFAEYLKEWHEEKQYDVGESQHIRIGQHLANAIPHVGHFRLDEIRPLHVLKLRKALANRLAPRTIRQMETHLRAALEATVGPGNDDYLEYNPLKKLKLMPVKKADERDVDYFEED
jgi:hypothetical protein